MIEVSKQVTFDTVVNGLREQKVQATEKDPEIPCITVCRYRTYKDGKCLKCAAGQLIPDDKYSDSIEGKSVITFSGDITEAGKLIESLGHNLQLVKDLQDVHDREKTTIENWEEGFKRVAEKHKLIYTPPTVTA